MQSDLQKSLQLNFFEQEGFVRKKCKKCGSYFWTKNEEQELCGDAPCVNYSFIGNPAGNEKHTLSSMRESFLSFFERNGHTRLKRYPVVARWRSDIYLTIASIADFQPHVTSGEVPPPANPLVISQPSIRLNDLEEVGRSGRHLTMFEMMGHHAFNNHEQVYWSEETIKYCSDFLEELGINKEEVTYKEGEWHGGGNAGVCLEVLVSGMEVATLVFMSLKKDSKGKYVVNGERYSEMPLRIVDTGYGLERLVWLTNGSPTVYDAIFPDVIEKIRNKAREKASMHDIYAVADHARCLAFMLSDGVVPSNAEEGYLARLVIRRALRLLSRMGADIELADIVEMHMESLSSDFPELMESKDVVREMLGIETEKFYKTLEKGRRFVMQFIKKEKGILPEDLVHFYDTYGIPPELVKEIAGMEIPENFYSMVAELHNRAPEEEKEEEKIFDYKTELMFYDKPYEKKFEASVLWKGDFNGRKGVILDRTLFYPEGGGQESDTGMLIQNGKKFRVLKAEKSSDAVVHIVEGDEISEGKVEGEIDWQKRYASMRHHTATHIINASARKVLGNHIWQRGSQLNENEARLDVSHFKRITPEEIKQIEKEANTVVMEAKEVVKEWLPRNEAEKKYGMRLYQGGAPKGKILRIVNIPEVDTEACGGTHVNNTAEIGLIKIIGTERIQDGVERIKFSAGYKSLEYVHRQEDLLRETAGILNVSTSVLPKTVKRFFEEWKKLRKQVENLQKSAASGAVETFKGIKIITQDGLTPAAIKSITGEGKTIVISGNESGKSAMITIASSSDVNIDCSKIASEAGRILGGRGGGRREVAQAGGPLTDKLGEAKKKAVEEVKKQLEKDL